MCGYYDLDKAPGLTAKGKFSGSRFQYLEDDVVISKLVQFRDDKQVHLTFYLPQIHCSSCVYLLENLHRIEPGIIASRSNFQRKEIFIAFDPSIFSVRKAVELLAFIGYEPVISLHEIEKNEEGSKRSKSILFDKQKIVRIGVAGFCFANIMMLSFPDYFASGHFDEQGLKSTFSWLILILSLPVLFFCASSIFVSSWKGLRQRYINIDVPIAIAITVTFARSYYEIIAGHGSGYLDSGSGIVFFMLIGRWFQDKTYDSLAFDRDYRSFLPLGVTIINDKKERNIAVTSLKRGDHILIRNGEMIPADAILLKGDANIDYSFVSGENLPRQKKPGELVHAGGKQAGNAIELEVIKEPSQSYIADLWNNDVFHAKKNKEDSFIHPWSRYFTIALFCIMFVTVVYWWLTSPTNVWSAATAVLIVACPCSLLLSATFTYGNMLRIFGKNKLYLKNANVIETLASTDSIVFDKTGTITEPHESVVTYYGTPLNDLERKLVGNMSRQSVHPLSKLITKHLGIPVTDSLAIKQFEEHAGQGVGATIGGISVKMGSAGYIGSSGTSASRADTATHIHVKIGDKIKGRFSIKNKYRNGISNTVTVLQQAGYGLHVLSGDNNSEKENLQGIFGNSTTIKFAQTPSEKLEYISTLQNGNRKILMVGDGINDSGALRQADVGISINNNDAQFTPACDAILDGESVTRLDHFLSFAKAGKKIVRASFILSIVYNIVGLSFAASGNLSPIVAAILMPASSITIVLFVTLASNIAAKRNRLLL